MNTTLGDPEADDRIDAAPTKAFFVDMLVRDIPLERAILDLVDNCIDGAKRLRDPANAGYSGLAITINLSTDGFSIEDNCGGFTVDTARHYAFRFGRPVGSGTTPYSIGQFGVGMKRALFKFGRHFVVSSTTAEESWSIDVEVDDWLKDNDWHFDFKRLAQRGNFQPDTQGTIIESSKLRPEVAQKFGSVGFRQNLSETIRVHQRTFISKGLTIRFNGNALSATNLSLLIGQAIPAVAAYEEQAPGRKPVKVRIVAGVGSSDPTAAGWYIICNGRIVLAADRSEETGWGLVAEQPMEIPKYHNQFSRFRGLAYFDCEDSERLPWNTTKTGVDSDAPVWRVAFEKMIVMARSVINFLNEVDKEIREQGRDGPLQKALAASASVQAETAKTASAFVPPDRSKFSGPVFKNISYSRPVEKVELLMEALGVSTAKAVGELTFDSAYDANSEE